MGSSGLTSSTGTEKVRHFWHHWLTSQNSASFATREVRPGASIPSSFVRRMRFRAYSPIAATEASPFHCPSLRSDRFSVRLCVSSVNWSRDRNRQPLRQFTEIVHVGQQWNWAFRRSPRFRSGDARSEVPREFREVSRDFGFFDRCSFPSPAPARTALRSPRPPRTAVTQCRLRRLMRILRQGTTP